MGDDGNVEYDSEQSDEADYTADEGQVDLGDSDQGSEAAFAHLGAGGDDQSGQSDYTAADGDEEWEEEEEDEEEEDEDADVWDWQDSGESDYTADDHP